MATNKNIDTNKILSDPAIQAEIDARARQLADSIVQDQAAQNTMVANGKVFTRFDIANDIVENNQVTVTEGLWSGGLGTLSTFFTSSLQTATQKQYYYEVYNSSSLLTGAESQYSIAYGHRLGSGSYSSGSLNDSVTRAIYSQYRLLLLQPGDTTFTFANSVVSDKIYVVNFNRARLKQKLDVGNWQINLRELNGGSHANIYFTGSNVAPLAAGRMISLIDDSSTQTATVANAGRIFNIVSGSITAGIHNSSAPKYYGLCYPDLGILILNGDMLDASGSFNTVTSSAATNINGDNAYKLFVAMSSSVAVSGSSFGFIARNEEVITSTHYFVRVKNGEYNFSNNPSYTTGSLGEFAQSTFLGDPKAYITTVGLYNDRQELLAVGKLSRPILKSFSTEVSIRIKLDF